MPRPKRTLAEADKNAEPAPAAKKASTGRAKAKGKENDLPVARNAPASKDKVEEFFAPRAKKISHSKPNEDKTDAIDPQDASTKEAASKENKTDAATADKVSAKESIVNEKDVAAAEEASMDKGKTRESDETAASNNANEASVTKEATAPSEALAIATEKSARIPSDADGKTWICICRPTHDIAKELDIDEDDDDENSVNSTCGSEKTCVCYRAADDYPEHEWIVTKKGFDLRAEWRDQQEKRSQDNFGMYIFNDFDGYGTSEVIENMFLAFAKEHKKKTQDPLEMWSIVESMALFFMTGDLMAWHMCDDSEGNAKRVMLIGTALLTTIDVLIQQGLFTNNSKIRNIGLILSQFLQFVEDHKEMCRHNEDGWKNVVVQKADTHGVVIQGLAGIDKLLEAIRSVDNSKDSKPLGDDFDNMMMAYKSRELSGHLTVAKLNSGVRRSWGEWNWILELSAFSSFQAVKVWANGPTRGGKIGGKFYDLTAQRNKGSHMKSFKLGKGGFGF